MPDTASSSWSALSEWEHDRIIVPMQARLRAFDAFFKFLGYTVQGEAILPVFASLYWCIDQHKCVAGIWLVPISEIANGIVKWSLRRPRPAWVDKRVRLLSWSSEFSFPSSHSQLAFMLAHWFVSASHHPQATSTTPGMASYLYAALVGLSRVHVGLHYPSDVVAGAVWGLVTTAAYNGVLPSLLRIAPSESSQLLLSLSIPGLVAAVAVVRAYRKVCESRGQDPPEWAANACRGKYKDRELEPRGQPLGSYTGMLGVLFGLAVGVAFKQAQPLALPKSARHSLLRAVLGNAGLMALFEGIAAATPRKPLAVYTSLRFIKYMMVPIYILLLAPTAFNAAGI